MRTHNLDRINALLRRAGAASAGRVHCFGEIGSTNSWLMKRRDIHARVCLAELQTAGRGRRGKPWRAPWSSSVLLSIGWRLGGADAAGLSLVAGLAAVDALRRSGADEVGLKWPNDLIARGAKLGGVLTELSGGHCVVGTGINVSLPPADEPGHAGEDSTGADLARIDLKSLGCDTDRDALAAALVISLGHYLRRFCGGGFAQFVEEWNGLNVHRGRRVTVALPAESFTGTVEGIDGCGALLIDRDGARRRIISGEASLRPAHPAP